MSPTVGPLAVKLLHHFEICKLKAYRCPAGVPTIGWGETGPHIQMGLTWTQPQADMSFKRRLGEFAAGVAGLVDGGAKTTPAQFGALVSFAYNVGTNALANSTLLRKHRAGDHEGAAAEFARWNKSKGRVLSGLTRRRAAEAALYRSDFAELARLTNNEVS